MAKKISSIEELIAVARGNQHIFRELNIANTCFKKSVAERYLTTSGAISDRMTKVNTYDLELLAVGIKLKKFRLKKKHPAWKAFLKKEKKIKFSVKIRKLSRSTLQIQLKHYRNDEIEDIVKYLEEYAEHRLKKTTSLWDLITLFSRNIWKKIAPVFKSTWGIIAPVFKDIWKIVTLLFKDTWSIIVPVFKDIQRKNVLFFKNIWRITALFFKDTWRKITLLFKNTWKRILSFFKK